MGLDRRGLGRKNAQDVLDQPAAGAPAEQANLVQQRFERAFAGLDLGDHVGDVLARGFRFAVDQLAGVGLQLLLLFGTARALRQVLAGGMQLQRGGGDKARIEGGIGEVLSQIFEPGLGRVAGLVHPADQAVGLDEPVVGGVARDIQPVLHEGTGGAEGGAPCGGLAFGGGEIVHGGIGPGLGDSVQGGLVELVCAGSAQGMGDADLCAGLPGTQRFEQQAEAGGVAGGEPRVAEHSSGRGEKFARGGQIGQGLGGCCAHGPSVHSGAQGGPAPGSNCGKH